jgi:hypothetical protein
VICLIYLAAVEWESIIPKNEGFRVCATLGFSAFFIGSVWFALRQDYIEAHREKRAEYLFGYSKILFCLVGKNYHVEPFEVDSLPDNEVNPDMIHVICVQGNGQLRCLLKKKSIRLEEDSISLGERNIPLEEFIERVGIEELPLSIQNIILGYTLEY